MEDHMMEGQTTVNGDSSASKPVDLEGIAVAVYLLAGLLVLVAAKAAASVIAPLILAIVIVLGVNPLQSWLISKGVGRLGAFLLTCLAVVVFIGAVLLLLTFAIAQFVGALPQYAAQIQATTQQIQSALKAAGFGTLTMPDTSAILSAVKGVAGWVASGVSSFAVALLLAVFLLADAQNFYGRLASVAQLDTTERTNRFAVGVRKWASITTMTNLLVAAGNTVILYLMGVPFPLLWGLLSFFLGYIPSIGFLVSLVPPAVMAFLQSGPTSALFVIVFYIVVNGVVQNLLMPRWMGEGLDLSPFIITFSLFFWAFLLGPLGAILAVPLTQVIRLALESSPATEYLGVLMASGNGQQGEGAA
jgi:AI-2 transport protein TqsA